VTQINIAVIGAGHLGRIHTRLLTEQPVYNVVGVVDPVYEARQQIAGDLGVPAFSDIDQLQGHLDAAIIAAPTHLHHEIAMPLLQQSLHLFVEKPIAVNVKQATAMVRAAQVHKKTLQVGHVERFNPAFTTVRASLTAPKYLEAVRTSGFTGRSTDIGVVLDLMIHDLDIVLDLTRSQLIRIDAIGMTLIGPHEDMAQARLQFADGFVANLSASRTSYQAQRTMRIFTSTGFVSLDFTAPSVTRVTASPQLLNGNIKPEQIASLKDTLFEDLLPMEEIKIESSNAILLEQQQFARAIMHDEPVEVPGWQARNTMAVAEQILQKIESHQNSARPLRKAG
jgi:predicted dehydrogenase